MGASQKLTKEEKAELRDILRSCRFKVGPDFWNYATPSTAWQRFRSGHHRHALALLRGWNAAQGCM